MQGVLVSRASESGSTWLVAMEDGSMLKAPLTFLKVVLPAEKNRETA